MGPFHEWGFTLLQHSGKHSSPSKDLRGRYKTPASPSPTDDRPVFASPPPAPPDAGPAVPHDSEYSDEFDDFEDEDEFITEYNMPTVWGGDMQLFGGSQELGKQDVVGGVSSTTKGAAGEAPPGAGGGASSTKPPPAAHDRPSDSRGKPAQSRSRTGTSSSKRSHRSSAAAEDSTEFYDDDFEDTKKKKKKKKKKTRPETRDSRPDTAGVDVELVSQRRGHSTGDGGGGRGDGGGTRTRSRGDRGEGRQKGVSGFAEPDEFGMSFDPEGGGMSGFEPPEGGGRRP